MQSTKKLTLVLRDLVTLLEEESSRNPAFAASLDTLLDGLPSRSGRHTRAAKSPKVTLNVPDVFVVFQDKGEMEFRFWVRSLDVPTLKAIIKANGFDAAKASHRWTDPDKFAVLVADQTIARMKRGSGFLTPKSGSDPKPTTPNDSSQ